VTLKFDLIHNFPYTQDENLAATMLVTIKQTHGVDIEFAIIHRNGIRGVHNGKSVTILAKLADRVKEEERKLLYNGQYMVSLFVGPSAAKI
jgi:hypothetical protein